MWNLWWGIQDNPNLFLVALSNKHYTHISYTGIQKFRYAGIKMNGVYRKSQTQCIIVDSLYQISSLKSSDCKFESCDAEKEIMMSWHGKWIHNLYQKLVCIMQSAPNILQKQEY